MATIAACPYQRCDATQSDRLGEHIARMYVIMSERLWRDTSWNIVKLARGYTCVKPYGGA